MPSEHGEGHSTKHDNQSTLYSYVFACIDETVGSFEPGVISLDRSGAKLRDGATLPRVDGASGEGGVRRR